MTLPCTQEATIGRIEAKIDNITDRQLEFRDAHDRERNELSLIKSQLVGIDARLVSLTNGHDEIHHRIVGNGRVGMVTIVDRHDQLLKGMMWTVGVVVTALIGLGIKVIFGRA